MNTAHRVGICSKASDQVKRIEKEIKINIKKNKKENILKGNKNNVCVCVFGYNRIYDIGSDSESVISVLSASSESVVVIETVEVAKDINKKEKKKYILRKENKKPVL